MTEKQLTLPGPGMPPVEAAVPQAVIDEILMNAAVAVSRKPETIVKEAQGVADYFDRYYKGKKKKIQLGGKYYLENPDWLMISKFYGCNPKIISCRYIELGGIDGFLAVAGLFDKHGREISRGEAICMRDESNWNTRPKYVWMDKGKNFAFVDGQKILYDSKAGHRVVFVSKKNGAQKVYLGDEPVPLFQLMSMAQTRASSKVQSLNFRWVVIQAGFEGTPAEEMPGYASQDFARQEEEELEEKETKQPPAETKKPSAETKDTPKETKAGESETADPDKVMADSKQKMEEYHGRLKQEESLTGLTKLWNEIQNSGVLAEHQEMLFAHFKTRKKEVAEKK